MSHSRTYRVSVKKGRKTNCHRQSEQGTCVELCFGALHVNSLGQSQHYSSPALGTQFHPLSSTSSGFSFQFQTEITFRRSEQGVMHVSQVGFLLL